MILTITNGKGGVGKTTMSCLLAKFISTYTDKTAIVIDIDHHGGATALLMSGSPDRDTIYDAVEAIEDGMSPVDIMRNSAVYPIDGFPNAFLIPSGGKKMNVWPANGLTTDLLSRAINEAEYDNDVVVIIDTGTGPYYIELGIEAADAVLVPVEISPQSMRPTAATLSSAVRRNKRILGLVPVAVGDAQWEMVTLDSLEQRTALLNEGLPGDIQSQIFPGIPYSRTIKRGKWIDGVFPKVCLDTMAAIYTAMTGEVVVIPN